MKLTTFILILMNPHLPPCPDLGVLLSDNVAVPIVPTMFHPDAQSGSAVLIAPVLVARITRMDAILGNAVFVVVTQSSLDLVLVVSVSPIARACGVHCTVGGPLFVLMSVALLLPVLLVCSELVSGVADFGQSNFGQSNLANPFLANHIFGQSNFGQSIFCVVVLWSVLVWVCILCCCCCCVLLCCCCVCVCGGCVQASAPDPPCAGPPCAGPPCAGPPCAGPPCAGPPCAGPPCARPCAGPPSAGHQNSTKKTKREGQKELKIVAGEGKKARNFGPPPFGAHPWGPTTSGPHPSGPTFGASPFGAPTFFWVWPRTLCGPTMTPKIGQNWIGQNWIGQNGIGQSRSLPLSPVCAPCAQVCHSSRPPRVRVCRLQSCQ